MSHEFKVVICPHCGTLRLTESKHRFKCFNCERSSRVESQRIGPPYPKVSDAQAALDASREKRGGDSR